MMRSTKPIKRPEVSAFVMTQNIEIAIIGKDTEVSCVGRIPLVVDFANVEKVIADSEAQRTLVRTKTGIAFNADFGHHIAHNITLAHVH
ncbi:MAG TPA: hypothetical protein VIY69_05515 [Candidatus Acidoferrales bacterium]